MLLNVLLTVCIYGIAQFKLDYTVNTCAAYTWHNMFFISIAHIAMHVFAHKINDVEALMQSTHVRIRRVHNNLYQHPCMSVIYTPNPVRMHIDVYIYEL